MEAMIRTKKKRRLTTGAIVMLAIYGCLTLFATAMALTDSVHRHGGNDARTVVAVSETEYQSYKRSQSARGSSGGTRVYVGGGYSYGK